MARAFKWTPKVLERAHAAAEFVDREHWLSTSGKQVLKVIDILSKGGSVFKPTASQVVDQLAVYGKEFGWDMNNMSTPQERGFLTWLVKSRMDGGK